MMKAPAAIVILLIVLTLVGCQTDEPGQVQTPAPVTPPSSSEVVSTPAPEEEAPAPEQAAAAPAPVVAASSSMSWYFKPNLEHATPQVSAEFLQLEQSSHAYYALPQNGSKIYLTFDEGYEQGYTGQILDTLKEYQVPAAFFITGHYLTSQPDLVKRMVSEGHQVANHTYRHPDLSSVDRERFNREVIQLAEEFQALTGQQMTPFLRPPMGKYSASTLQWAKELGYTTVFWSMAFHDWDPQKQPGADYSHRYVTEHIHPGAIILLHAVSESNTLALPAIIEDLRAAGYEFALLPQ